MHRLLLQNIHHELNLLHGFLFIGIFIIGGNLKAQDNYYEKVFTTDNGLPHNHVLSIAQDKTGFLWIGTWDGLSRYDGYEFRNYFHDPEDTTNIPLFNIGSIKVDRNNNIWIFSLSNVIAHYVKSTDNFKRLDYRSDSVLSKTGIESIAIGPDGCLWIAGQGGLARNIWYSTLTASGMGTGLHRYDKTPDHFKHFLTEIDSKPSVVYSIFKDKNNNLLIGAQGNNYIASIRRNGK